MVMPAFEARPERGDEAWRHGRLRRAGRGLGGFVTFDVVGRLVQLIAPPSASAWIVLSRLSRCLPLVLVVSVQGEELNLAPSGGARHGGRWGWRGRQPGGHDWVRVEILARRARGLGQATATGASWPGAEWPLCIQWTNTAAPLTGRHGG